MAKWGDEQDPRWQVKDMGTAGRNVNNWHWDERVVTDPFCQYLKAQLLTARVALDGGELVLDDKTTVSGKVITECRKKQPRLFLQPLFVTLHWASAEIEGSEVASSSGSLSFQIDEISDIVDLEIKLDRENDQVRQLLKRGPERAIAELLNRTLASTYAHIADTNSREGATWTLSDWRLPNSLGQDQTSSPTKVNISSPMTPACPQGLTSPVGAAEMSSPAQPMSSSAAADIAALSWHGCHHLLRKSKRVVAAQGIAAKPGKVLVVLFTRPSSDRCKSFVAKLAPIIKRLGSDLVQVVQVVVGAVAEADFKDTIRASWLAVEQQSCANVQATIQQLIDDHSWGDAPDIHTATPHCVVLDAMTGEVINSSATEQLMEQKAAGFPWRESSRSWWQLAGMCAVGLGIATAAALWWSKAGQTPREVATPQNRDATKRMVDQYARQITTGRNT